MIRNSRFRPAWWLPGPHLQTAWPTLFRRRRELHRQRERIALADGDFVDLDWVQGRTEDQPLVLILHGLTGSSDSNYAWGLQLALQQQGWHSVVMNFRGCSGEPNHLPRTYHSGETGDLHEVFTLLRQRHPQRAFAAAGFSLGGNVLLKWLGEHGSRLDLQAAVAVSVPFRLEHCQRYMDRGLARMYRNRLIRQLQYAHSGKLDKFEERRQQEHAMALRMLGNVSRYRSFFEYDEYVTAPLHGFQGAQDYYRHSSSIDYLQHICVPTLLLHAANDPFMGPAAVPDPALFSDAVQMELSRGGGHVGFVTGANPFRPRYWLEQRIPEFLGKYLKAHQAG